MAQQIQNGTKIPYSKFTKLRFICLYSQIAYISNFHYKQFGLSNVIDIVQKTSQLTFDPQNISRLLENMMNEKYEAINKNSV